jgi:acyl-coenzyme A thioesterase PaaI-like protein
VSGTGVGAGAGAAAGPVTYPPDHHVLRDLPFTMEAVDPTSSRGRLTVTPELCVAGRLSAGPLMTMVDVLVGSLVGRVLAPDWMATAQMSLHLDRPPGHGDVVADARVVRNGRTTVVAEVRIATAPADGTPPAPVGEAMLTFVRLPRRDSNIDLSGFEVRYGEPMSFALPSSGLHRPWGDALGVVASPEPGVLAVEVDPYVRNSFGAVNGGVVASVADAAARAAAADEVGGPVRTTDAVVHYLTQGRVGPLSTATRILRSGPAGVSVRAEVRDDGDLGPDGGARVMVVAHVHCVPTTPSGHEA